jgi:hypothetical protein
MLRKLCILLILLSFSAISGTDQAIIRKTETVETLYALATQGKAVEVQVMSNGCTSLGSFQLRWQGDKVSIMRIKPDLCRKRSFKKSITFVLPKRINNFQVVNHFAFIDSHEF